MIMADTTEIEKKSLEAHVELCAERYRFLENRLTNIDEKIESQSGLIGEVHDMLQKITEKRNDQIVTWGLMLIVGLLGVVGYLISHHVLK